MVTVTSLHFSPNVLMISAVCGRAPPWVSPPNAPLEPPECPEISQDLLSVTKTRALSCANSEPAKRQTAMMANFLDMEAPFTWEHVSSRLWFMESESQQNSTSASTSVPWDRLC